MQKILAAVSLAAWFCTTAVAEPIKVGVSVTLTGEAATFGIDMKNAITMANRELGDGRYQLIVEDEKCAGKDAVSVAHKLTGIDRVKYVIGFSCNQALLAAAPIYDKAKTIVISGFGTSGDIKEIGDRNFRLFPADQGAIDLIYPYIAERHEMIGIVSEENEFTELMRRTFEKLYKQNPGKKKLFQESFHTGDNDLKPVLMRLKANGVTGLFLNPNAEPSFIRLVQQLNFIKFKPVLYTAYWPAATVVQESVAKEMEGMVFANLPDMKKLLSKKGQDLVQRFRKEFGEPNSVPYNVAFAYETFRLLNEALRSGMAPEKYLRTALIKDGVIGTYSFDDGGAVRGIGFELQEFKNGAISPLTR